MTKLMKRLARGGTLAVALTGAGAVQAADYDLDCGVILCLAGGFAVSGCEEPFEYMMDRLTDIPPRPPFGVCTGADGEPYEGATARRRGFSNVRCVARRSFEGDSFCVRWRVTERRWLEVEIEGSEISEPYEGEYVYVDRDYFTSSNPRSTDR